MPNEESRPKFKPQVMVGQEESGRWYAHEIIWELWTFGSTREDVCSAMNGLIAQHIMNFYEAGKLGELQEAHERFWTDFERTKEVEGKELLAQSSATIYKQGKKIIAPYDMKLYFPEEKK